MQNTLSAYYDFDNNVKVWRNKDAKTFNYSDGDSVETALAEKLAKVRDRSVHSDELKSILSDWPTTYYFSANRSNLLRSLDKKLLNDARVLELGCGMGAITRYLGETAREVVAVEGSVRRGSIAAMRCEDLSNVHVIIDEIKALPNSLGTFDVVTLIGVLEYACCFGGPGAELEVLKKARSFLKPDGFLVLAIENKLGLKYLGGVPEDHLQRSFAGFTNGYRPDGVQTWSRLELETLLHEAGFNRIEQFIALPDYKLPTTIITPEALECRREDLDLAPILNNTKRLYEPLPMFNAAEAWESVYKGGLLRDLADSLCFVATPAREAQSPFMEGELANHYGNLDHLSHKFSKNVKIRREGGEIKVARERLLPASAPEIAKVYQKLEDEPYLKGEFLLSRIRKVAMRPDWTVEEFFEAFEPWVKALKKRADSDWMCDGALLDFMPFNLFLIDGEVAPFDLEWISREKLPLTYLLFRGFIYTLFRIFPLRKSKCHTMRTLSDLFKEFIRRQNLPPELPQSYDYLWWQELKLMRELKNNPQGRTSREVPIIYMD